MPTLVYWDSDGVERVFELGTEPILIGRAAECAIRSEDTRVSRRHARLVSNGRDCWIEDMGSSNGVYVGPNRVTQTVIPPGEIVIVGSILLQLQAGANEVPMSSTGTHAQLSVWLKMEREKYFVLARERDGLNDRVMRLEGEAKKNTGMLPAEIERQVRAVRSQLAAEHNRELERWRRDAEMEREQALARQRAELEAEFEVTKQALFDEANRQRTEIDVSDQLQVQVQQLWSNLRATKQTIRQLEEEAKEREARVTAAESTRAEMQDHAKKLATEVQRLSRLDKERQERLDTLETERAAAIEERTDLEVQLAEMQERIDQANDRATQAVRAAQAEAEEARAELARIQTELGNLQAQGVALGQDKAAGLAEAEERAAAMERRYLEVLGERESLAKERDLLIEERDELTAELLELRDAGDNEREKSQAVLVQAKSRLHELAAQVDELVAERDELAAEFDQLAAQYDELVVQRDALAKRFDELTKQHEQLAEKNTNQDALMALQAERDQLRTDFERLSSEAALMRDELEDLREQTQDVQEDSDVRLAAMHKEKQAIAKERERLVQQLDLALKERDKLTSEIGSLRVSRETEREEAARRLADARADYERTQAALEELGRELAASASMRQEFDAIRERYTELERSSAAQAQRLNEEIEQLSGDLREFEATLKERDQEISSLREREEELVAGLESTSELNARLDSMRQERETYRLRAEELEEQSQTADARVQELESQIQTMSAELEAARTELRSLHDKLVDAPPDALGEEVQDLRDRLADACEELAELGEQAAQYSQERALRHSAEQRVLELEERTRALEAELGHAAASATSDGRAGGYPDGASEHIMAIQDCIAALRINMRAASDETAIMPGDSDSVQVITDAVSQAMEQIETARDSLRRLEEIFDIG